MVWLLAGDGFGEAIKYAANPPADLNSTKDEVVTLFEIYKYVQANIKNESSSKYWQTACVWPANDPSSDLVDPSFLAAPPAMLSQSRGRYLIVRYTRASFCLIRAN